MKTRLIQKLKRIRLSYFGELATKFSSFVEEYIFVGVNKR